MRMELDMITGLGEFLGISMAHQASANDCYSPNLLDSHQDPIPTGDYAPKRYGCFDDPFACEY